MTGQLLGLVRSRRLASASMAVRIMSRRASPGSNSPSRRAVVPSANGRVMRSANSFRRPTERGFSYVPDSIKRHLFVCTLLTAYHRYDIASIVDMKGRAVGTKSQAPVGSRWAFNTETQGRVFVVTARKPGGVICIKQEGRFVFGESYLRDWLRNATLLEASQ